MNGVVIVVPMGGGWWVVHRGMFCRCGSNQPTLFNAVTGTHPETDVVVASADDGPAVRFIVVHCSAMRFKFYRGCPGHRVYPHLHI